MSGNAEPFDFAQARDAINVAKAAQRAAQTAARNEFIRAKTAYANAEQTYRIALAQEITRLKGDGVAWTTCGDLARGEKRVAHLRYLRDIADGVREAALQAMKEVGFTHAADRRELEQLVEWSRRVDGQVPEPDVYENVTPRRVS